MLSLIVVIYRYTFAFWQHAHIAVKSKSCLFIIIYRGNYNRMPEWFPRYLLFVSCSTETELLHTVFFCIIQSKSLSKVFWSGSNFCPLLQKPWFHVFSQNLCDMLSYSQLFCKYNQQSWSLFSEPRFIVFHTAQLHTWAAK